QDWSGWLLAEASRLAGSAFLGGQRVERIDRVAADPAQGHSTARWQVLDATGAPIAQAPVMVLANALDLPRLLPADGPRPRLGAVRGQTTVLPTESTALTPRHALSGAGYALGLPDGRRLCGATSQHDDVDGQVRRSDHAANLRRAAALGLFDEAGRQAVAALAADEEPFAALGVDPGPLDGRCGWRATTADRLPLVGPLPDLQAVARSRAAGARLDSPRQWPRQHDADGGLYLCTGLGSRGLTSAALAGELLAAWITGAPFPVEAELRDALDPARQT
ncbi:MAG: FAD-dependent oxidoreductase, partial [Leptothrix sp. (in: Bacteria)]|nr:FAD-dependent oxidoreductase [Leptothrix sp. (in: b-proteobacteria)]